MVNFTVTLNNGTVPITSRPNEPEVLINGAMQGTSSVVALTGSTPNQVVFTGVTVPSGNPTISFIGIRANVNPSYVPLNSGGFGQVLAVVGVENGSLPFQQVNNGFFVGIVEPGLGAVTTTGPTLNQCAGTVSLTAGGNFTISVSEFFPTAFKAQGFVGNVNDSETGNSPQQANSGTQLALTFGNLPSALTFYLPLTITASDGAAAQLVTGAGSITPIAYTSGTDFTLSPAGPCTATTATCYYPVTAGTTAYYNVVLANVSAIDTFSIPLYNSAATYTASSSFAPTVTVNLGPAASAVSSTFVPRFAGAAGATGLGFTTAGCQTSLLFPFLTNQAGFDTGLSIAATGTDPFMTGIAGGTCTLNMYGANPPTTAPTLTIPAGGENHTTVSAVAPNFQGYAIAVCNFTYAHGYAFITDGFMGPGRGLSEGYVGLVITDRGASTGGAESLSH
jgi:hypothetical protein